MRMLILSLSLLLTHGALAHSPADPDRSQNESAQARCVLDSRIVRERHGHPGKGIVTVRREPRADTECISKAGRSGTRSS